MKFFSYLSGILLLFIVSIPMLLLFVLIEGDAAFQLEDNVTQQQMENLQQILIDYDPRYLANADGRRIELDETELNAVLFYLSRQIDNGDIPGLVTSNLLVDLQPGQAILRGSIEIPASWFGRYINFEAFFQPQNGTARLAELTLAGHTVPDLLLTPTVSYVEQQLQRDDDYALFNTLRASISELGFHENMLTLLLDSNAGNLALMREQARLLLIDEATAAMLIDFQQQLVQTVNALPESTRRISLNQLLAPLFSHALTVAGDPDRENRAIFLILSCYLLDELELADLLGEEAGRFADMRELTVTLEARDDLPRHLIASAAIASSADDDLASVVSIYKEVQDSKTESGFSFSDITANLIGTRLGTLSAESQAYALRLQSFFSQVDNETDYIPLLGRPDGISEEEFARLYQSRESGMFQQRMQEIDASVAALPVFSILQNQGQDQSPD